MCGMTLMARRHVLINNIFFFKNYFYIFINYFIFPVLFTGPDIPGFLLQPFRKPKRIRTAFSPSQLLKLEHAFEKNHYVVGAERKQLAQSLSLTETQVSLDKQKKPKGGSN